MSRLLALTIAASFVGALVARGEEIASGLAPGGHPQPLQVRDCTGPAAGKTLCYTCRYAERPTTAIFVRELSPAIGKLAQRIDRELGEHRDQRPAAYLVIIAADNAEVEASLKSLAKERELRHLPLTILRDRPSKLASAYGVAQAAAVTVMHWRDGTVAASRGFSISDLTDADIERIVNDTAKILD